MQREAILECSTLPPRCCSLRTNERRKKRSRELQKRRERKKARSRTLFLPRLLPRFSYVNTQHRHLALEFQVPRAPLRRESKAARSARAPRRKVSLLCPMLGCSSTRPLIRLLLAPLATATDKRIRSWRGKKARGARKSCIGSQDLLYPTLGSTHRYARRIHRDESSV